MLKHTFIIATLLLATAASCKDSASKDVTQARENTVEKQADLAKAEQEVQAATLAVSRARGDFLVVADVRLAELDKKIAEMKLAQPSKTDWNEIARLRSSAEQLRNEIKSNAKIYAQDVQREFEELVGKIDESLK
ncbi:MAG: hypothetical protein IPL79_17995 [Myxococcales bacterium]|nr:hypothetical protein [Myxococcales bacterium]